MNKIKEINKLIYFITKFRNDYVIYEYVKKIYYDFDYRKIGINIKNARMKKLYTQEMLAEKVELSCKYISRLEMGMTGIRLETLAKICNALEVSIDEILK